MTPADRLPRRPDYLIGYENVIARLQATRSTTTITESYGDLHREIKAAQENDLLATKIWSTIVNVSVAGDSQ
jgi:hypothetical protein